MAVRIAVSDVLALHSFGAIWPPNDRELPVFYGLLCSVLGRQVRVLLDGAREAGGHEVAFVTDGLPSGTYLYRLETPQGSFVQTMLLAK